MFNLNFSKYAPIVAGVGMACISGLHTIQGSLMENFLRYCGVGFFLDFVYSFYAWIWAALIVLLCTRWFKNPWFLGVFFLILGLFIRFVLLQH